MAFAGGATGTNPVPDSVIAAGLPGAVLTTDIVPELVPPAIGANDTVRTNVPLAASVNGKTGEFLRAYPCPVTKICEIVALVVDAFVSVTA